MVGEGEVMEEKRKQQWIVMVCCFIAAFCLWLYISNMENIVKTNRISVPVSIVNEESLSQYKLAVLTDQQYKVTVTVKGVLPYIDEVKASDFKIVADLGEYAVKKGENKIPLVIKEIPQNVNIINRDTLWAIINIDDLSEKSVPVKVEVTGNVKDGYSALDAVLTPKEVTISGAAKYVNSVKSVNTSIDIKDASKDISTSLPLQAYNDSNSVVTNVKVQPSVVSVLVPVQKTKSVSINVPTKGNLNKSLLLKSVVAVPEKIDISGGTQLSGVTQINTEPIDLSTINDSGTISVKLVVPDGVKLVDNSISTVQAKVTVEKIVQKNFSLDIQTKNLSDGYNATLSSSKTSLVASGAESIINDLKIDSSNCYVDLSSLAEGDYTVPVTVNVPNGINKISLSPDTIKVTIKKKDAGTASPTPTAAAAAAGTPTPTASIPAATIAPTAPTQ